MGQVLCRLSETYPGLLKAVIEAVQNGIDADATVIFVGIDQRERRVAVCDNGSGITPTKFQQALGTIGQSMKDRKPGTLGRFGLGLVAPVTKCQTMQIVSTVRGQTHRWVFNRLHIERQANTLDIPYGLVDGLPVLPEPFEHAAQEAKPKQRGPRVTWRTMVLMDRVTADRTVSAVDIDDLAHDIQVKLGGGMKVKGTTVFIKIRELDGKVKTTRVDPLVYSGHKLEPFAVDDDDAGQVRLELYRAKQTSSGVRHGEVKVSETGAADAISWADFARQARNAATGDPILTAALEALGSGYFEGDVTASRIEMHPDRKKFVYNDAVWGLLSAISEWYVKVGQAFVEQERELQNDERYLRLGQQSLKNLLDKIQQNPRLSRLFDSLGEALPRASRAERLPNTTPRQRREQNGERRPVVARPPQQSEDGSTSTKAPAFLAFVYHVIDGPQLWLYDPETARLTINVTHPLWVKMDDTNGRHLKKNDQYISFFQDWLLTELIYLLATHPSPEELERGLEQVHSKSEMAVEVLVIRS
jgi:hypothetical protein